MNFKIIIEKDEDGIFVATCPSLPGCISQGKSEKQAIRNMKEAVELHVKSFAEDGLPLKPNGARKEILIAVGV